MCQCLFMFFSSSSSSLWIISSFLFVVSHKSCAANAIRMNGCEHNLLCLLVTFIISFHHIFYEWLLSLSLYLCRLRLKLIKSALFPSLLCLYYCHRLNGASTLISDCSHGMIQNAKRFPIQIKIKTNRNLWILQFKWHFNFLKKTRCVKVSSFQ